MSNWRLGWRFIKGIDILPHYAGGVAAPQALHGSKGGFSFAKENPPFGTPRERLDIAGEQLEELQCWPIALPCARHCRV